MRFKVSLLFPEVHPYMMYCFQMQKAYKRSSTSPDDAKQVKEMTNIPIRCLNHFKIYFNPSNSERIHLIQNDSIQFRKSLPLFYIHSIYPEMIPSASDSLHSIQRKFIHITFIPVK